MTASSAPPQGWSGAETAPGGAGAPALAGAETRGWSGAETALGWSVVVEALAARCVNDEAADRARARRPLDDAEAISAAARRLAGVMALLDAGASLPVERIEPVTALLARVERGGLLEGRELLAVATLLAATARLRAWLASVSERAAERGSGSIEPALVAVLQSSPALDAPQAELERCLASDGTLVDGASPALESARRRLKDARRAVTAELDRVVATWGDRLRDRFWTERDGRWVVPVRSDSHQRVDGAVVGASASGATLYVEPRTVTALASRLRLAELEAEREEERVRAALCAALAAHLPALREAHAAALAADEHAALGRLTVDLGGSVLAPVEGAGLAFTRLRHPALVLRGGAVPSDFTLRPGTGLVISGPNAGGKTVALEALGLAVLMAHAGLPVCAGPDSVVGRFHATLATVGDGQSLEASLSTFTAEVADLRGMLAAAAPGVLVLIDEIAAGTDPDEGAALGVAVLEALVAAGATVVVTTHFARLKELAWGDARFVNAGVGFDPELGRPTFRVHAGVTGASSALVVAAQHGLPAALVDRARALLPEHSLRAAALLAELEQERTRTAALREALEQELAAERARIAEDERARAREAAEAQTDLGREARELGVRVRTARARLAAAEREIADARSAADLRALERRVDAAAHEIALGSPVARATGGVPGGGTRPGAPRALSGAGGGPGVGPPLVVGGAAVHVETGARVEVLELLGERVRVQSGAVKLLVAVEALRALPGGRAAGTAPRQQPGAARARQGRGGRSGAPPRHDPGERAEAAPVRVRHPGNTLDLRGVRVEEALLEVDAFVDRAALAGEEAVFVLHGHGTGALKAAVREHLRALAPRVASSPAEPEDGGDAFTVVTF